jgi:hypothetical protein
MKAKDERPLVEIRYRNGDVVRMRVTNFKVTRSLTGGLSLEWENATPDPMFIGINDIQSIWEVAE